MFTEIHISGKTELALAPLSVLPEYQRQGIGKALIAQGHKIAVRMGYEFSVVLGSEEYYLKAGYVPAEQYGIKIVLTAIISTAHYTGNAKNSSLTGMTAKGKFSIDFIA